MEKGPNLFTIFKENNSHEPTLDQLCGTKVMWGQKKLTLCCRVARSLLWWENPIWPVEEPHPPQNDIALQHHQCSDFT